MMRIDCPFCGPRDHDEFTYEGDAAVAFPPLDAPAEAWCEAVYFHENPRGPTVELWWHALGCRAFLTVERDTLTHAIGRVALADPAEAEALPGEAPEAPEGTGPLGRPVPAEPAE